MGWTPLGFLAAGVTFFHISEFIFSCLTTGQLALNSLLISKPYVMAMSCGVVEYLIENTLFPRLKAFQVVSYMGLGLMILGEAIRKCGQITAGRNFTHAIRFERDPRHQLITHGIYRYIRHPGYLGWFLWATGTQVLLLNPLCTPAFAFMAWRFFQLRIPIEEQQLENFFGDAYREYRMRTHTWIPFIP